jgi:SAM-dependent methyltransferase
MKESVRTSFDTLWARGGTCAPPNGGRAIREYWAQCERREMGFLRARMFREPARYFLDAGAGAFPHTQCSELYARHVCLDVSLAGLLTAKEKLGARGLCVVGDLAHLPFRDGVFQGVLSSHALFYLSRRDHRRAVAEIVRVLSHGSPGAIIYDTARSCAAFRWVHAATERYGRWRTAVGRIPGVRRLRALLGGVGPPRTVPAGASASDPAPGVPARHLPARWFVRELASAGQRARLRGHHLFSYRLEALTNHIPDNAAGGAFLWAVSRLETWLPSFLGAVATDVTLVFRKISDATPAAEPAYRRSRPGSVRGRRRGRRGARSRALPIAPRQGSLER